MSHNYTLVYGHYVKDHKPVVDDEIIVLRDALPEGYWTILDFLHLGGLLRIWNLWSHDE